VSYKITIEDPKGEIIYNKSIPTSYIDKTNFTRIHKLKAILNILSKMGKNDTINIKLSS
jgi:hypothetical protein